MHGQSGTHCTSNNSTIHLLIVALIPVHSQYRRYHLHELWEVKHRLIQLRLQLLVRYIN